MTQEATTTNAAAAPAAPATTTQPANAPGASAMDALADRLGHCYTGAIYDVLREMKIPHPVLPSHLRPLDPARKAVGVAYTVSGHRRDGLDPHETLLAWTALLSRAPRGCVLVCQPHDGNHAHMGELSAEALHFRGIRGYVVDGGCRDSEFIVRLGFPVWCKYFTPMDIVGRWVANGFGDPVEIGSTLVRTGDLIIADRDGIISIPANIAAEVVGKAEQIMQTENKVRAAILQGMDPQDAYLHHGKF